MRMEKPTPAPTEPGEPGKNSYLDYVKQKQEEIKAELAAKETPAPEDSDPTGQRASVTKKGALDFGQARHAPGSREDAQGNELHLIDQSTHEYLERVRATQADARRQLEKDKQAAAYAQPGSKETVPPPQVSPEEMARQEREKKDQLMLYRIVSGDSKAKEVPAGFKATPETKQAAESFFRSRDGLLESYKKEYQAKRLAKKSGYEQGGAATAEAVVWRENAQKEYEKKLEGLKKELFEDFIEKKREKYPNLTKKEMQEEALKYSAGFVLETAKDIDMDLEAEKNRVAYETKEKGIAAKLWEKYTKAPRWKKWAIGAGVAGAVGLTGALLFPSTLLFAGSAATLSKVGVGGFLAARGVRSIVGGALGAAIFSGLEKFHIRGKYGKKRAETGATQSTETLEKLKQEIGTAEDWLENEEIKMKLMTIVDADAVKYREKLDKIANKEGRSRLYAALVAGIIGGAAATAAGLDWSQVFPGGPKGGALVGALEGKPATGGAVPHPLESSTEWQGGDGVPTEGGVVPQPLESSTEWQGGAKIISGIETAKSGDSIWGMAERQLEQRIPGFKDLNEAQKTYLIDAIKDKIAENPGKFGLTDPDKLAIDQKIDFSLIFEKDSDLQELVDKAKGLTGAQMENIERNNAILRDWVKNHSGEALTSDKVEDILRGAGKGGATPGPELLSDENYKGYTPEKPDVGGDEVLSEGYTGSSNIGGEDFSEVPEGGAEPGGVEAMAEKIVSEYGTKMETAVARIARLNVSEYNAIKAVTVEKLLTEIPSEDDAWKIWRGEVPDKTPGLPHDGIYGAFEYKSQIRLAEFIRNLDPGENLRKLTVQKFLILFGPK